MLLLPKIFNFTLLISTNYHLVDLESKSPIIYSERTKELIIFLKEKSIDLYDTL